MHLIRRDKAERGIVDLEIAGPRRQPNVRNCRAAGQILPIGPVVGCDLLDVDRRREFVESKMMGIDHLDAFSRYVPKSAIARLRESRSEGGRRTLEHGA